MSAAAVEIGDIHAAAARLKGIAHRTPLLESELLNRAAGRRVLVKAEALQRTGSFKFRGAWNALAAMGPEARSRGVAAFSSGNHAQAVAAAAEAHGTRARLFMPSDAPALKRAHCVAHGAEITLFDRAQDDRAALAEAAAAEGAQLIHPYDEPMVIAGQGTVGLEIAEQAAALNLAPCPVFICAGGGGLASGVAIALAASAPGFTPRTAEPEGFDDWRRSLAAGARVANARAAGSICDAILTPQPGALTWALAADRLGPGAAVSDGDARRAMAAAHRHLKLVLEPGGAVALAAALFTDAAADADPVIVVATGGNVDPAAYAAWITFDEWRADGLPA